MTRLRFLLLTLAVTALLVLGTAGAARRHHRQRGRLSGVPRSTGRPRELSSGGPGQVAPPGHHEASSPDVTVVIHAVWPGDARGATLLEDSARQGLAHPARQRRRLLIGRRTAPMTRWLR